MQDVRHKLSREEIAKIDIGHTKISRTLVGVLVVAFLATIYSVPVAQHVVELRRHAAGERAQLLPQCYDIFRSAAKVVAMWPETAGPFYKRVYELNKVMLKDIHAYEDALEETSYIGGAILPQAQYVLTRVFGVGNEKTYCGLGGWLYYRLDVEYLTGPGFLDPKRQAARVASSAEWRGLPPQPDPVKAIVQFKEQLEQRGIPLVVMPAPAKPGVHPERFAAGYRGRTAPLVNLSYADFVAQLRMAGVHVFDMAEALVEARDRLDEPQFIATDSHWRPEAMEFTADKLAEFLRRTVELPDAPPAGYTRQAAEVTNRGDIAVMLKLPPGREIYAPEKVALQQVRTAIGGPWQPDASSDVLFLGDSFGNIFSLDSMGWGEGAGFVEQLSYALQRPVDRIVRNDHGAYATRQMLSQELAKGRDRLAGKRVVVWEFAMHELADGDWRLIEMNLGRPPPPKFIVPAPGAAQAISGVVEAIAPVPKPGSVPYKDHIIAIHLIDVANEAGPVPGGEALVYAWSMRDNVWTPAARVRAGEKIKLRIQSWSDVAEKYDAVNRTELDDERLMLETPCWGEILK